MRRAAALLALVLSAAAARAQAPATVFRSRSDYNLHMAGMRGAQGAHLDARVTFDEAPRAGQPVVVSDEGERRDYHSSPRWGVTETRTEWHHRWRGTARADGAGLRIELRLGDSRCLRAHTEYGRAEPPGTCPGPPARIVLDCTPDPAGIAGAPRAMRCTSADALPADASPLPWWIDAGGCIERSGGAPLSGPTTFARCAP